MFASHPSAPFSVSTRKACAGPAAGAGCLARTRRQAAAGSNGITTHARSRWPLSKGQIRPGDLSLSGTKASAAIAARTGPSGFGLSRSRTAAAKSASSMPDQNCAHRRHGSVALIGYLRSASRAMDTSHLSKSTQFLSGTLTIRCRSGRSAIWKTLRVLNTSSCRISSRAAIGATSSRPTRKQQSERNSTGWPSRRLTSLRPSGERGPWESARPVPAMDSRPKVQRP